MSQFSELVSGSNAPAWREHVESLVTEDSPAFEARLDGLQTLVNTHGWHPANGHELEFRLASRSGRVPDRVTFYEAYLRRMCGRVTPIDAEKGDIFDPRTPIAPVFISKDHDGRYLWESQDDTTMETATMPSNDWRESNRRYWNVISTLGEVAAGYGCRVKILGTHMSTSIAYLHDQAALTVRDHIKGAGRMLVAMQRTREILQPLEPYTSLLEDRGETFPSKAVLWALHPYRVETRFPVFGIADTRLAMLGALAGIAQSISEDLPHDRTALHRCNKIIMDNPRYPELNTLSEVMVWDRITQNMVLPEAITRDSVATALAAVGLEDLDRLAGTLAGADEADFSADNARILREAVRALRLEPSGTVSIDSRSPYADIWNRMLHGATMTIGRTARLVPSVPAEESVGYVPDRERAMRSPQVAAILGPRLLAALTPPMKAYRLRALTLASRTTPSARRVSGN